MAEFEIDEFPLSRWMRCVFYKRGNVPVTCSSWRPRNFSTSIEVLEFKELSKHKLNSEGDCKYSKNHGSQKTCAKLDYIYHTFDKYAISSALCSGSVRGAMCILWIRVLTLH